VSTQEEPGDGAQAEASAAPGEPTEEQLRAAYEEELSRISATDMIAQATVSLLNVGAHRLSPPAAQPNPAAGGPTQPQRDLEQARDAIDAVRALLEILERRIPQEVRPLRDALSRLQMAYASEVKPGGQGPAEGQGAGGPGAGGTDGGGSPGGGPDGSGDAGAGGQPTAGERPPGPGPAEASGRLWVPGR
jgi:hypothetical protein